MVVAIQDNEARLFAAALQGCTRVDGGLFAGYVAVYAVDRCTAGDLCRLGKRHQCGWRECLHYRRVAFDSRRRTGFELWLAGDVCQHALGAPGVHKLGRVESVAQSYAQGALVVNPVRMGTGLNIKTMQCLALGVPLVVTESGSRGLENLRGRAFLAVADDDAAAMAAGVVRVLRATLVREALAAAQAWNLVQLENLAGALQHPAQMMT